MSPGSSVLLPPDSSARESARDCLRSALDAAGADGATFDDALLVVTELVVHACLFGGDGPVRLTIDASVDDVWLRVSTATGLPDDWGNGLHVVGQLSADWGVSRGSTDRAVWARVDRAAGAGTPLVAAVPAHPPAAPLPLTELGARLSVIDARARDLWLVYASHGGQASPLEADAYVHGALNAGDAEMARLEHALWEMEQGFTLP